MPSDARTWGDCITRVVLSVINACSSAPGRLTEKSARPTLPNLASRIGPDDVVEGLAAEGVGVPELAGVVGVVLFGTWRELRGVKPMGRFSPVLPPETRPRAKSRVRERLAFSTMISTTTSALALSRSWNSFSASAI